MDVTSSSVSAPCSASGAACPPAMYVSPAATTGRAHSRPISRPVSDHARFVRRPSHSSRSTVSAASSSASQTVPGTRPSCSVASVSALYATNSPCGMRMTRVTANTSTMAMPSKAYTAPLPMPSSSSTAAIVESIPSFH